MGTLILQVVCPKSVTTWRARPRADPRDAARQRLTCPSCGQGLSLERDGHGNPAVRDTGPIARAHRIAGGYQTNGPLTTRGEGA